MEELVPLISVATALVAVIVGPLVSVYVVRRQNRVDVLATNRQTWINSLRECVADYAALLTATNVARSENALSDADALIRLEKAFALEGRILLMLNPSEEDHSAVAAITTDARNAVFRSHTDAYDPNAWSGLWKRLIRVVAKILKEEWERVKSLD